MDRKHIEVVRKGKIAVVRFDRGDALNCLSASLIRGLTLTARDFEDDTDTVAVILTGAGKCFSAGMDLRDPELRAAGQGSIDKKLEIFSLGPKMCRAWERIPQITIAAIEGFCIGGGVSLAVSCDFRVMGESGYFRVPELDLGFNMSWQTLPRLANLVGPSRAKRIVLLSEKIDAECSNHWGLVDQVAADGSAETTAFELADNVASKPPIPVKMTKRAINAHVNALNDVASFMDADQFTLTQMTEDHREGLEAFEQKRVPVFKGK